MQPPENIFKSLFFVFSQCTTRFPMDSDDKKRKWGGNSKTMTDTGATQSETKLSRFGPMAVQIDEG